MNVDQRVDGVLRAPSKTASTVPSPQLRTQPATPRALRLAAGAVAEEDPLHAPGGADPAADGDSAMHGYRDRMSLDR